MYLYSPLSIACFANFQPPTVNVAERFFSGTAQRHSHSLFFIPQKGFFLPNILSPSSVLLHASVFLHTPHIISCIHRGLLKPTSFARARRCAILFSGEASNPEKIISSHPKKCLLLTLRMISQFRYYIKIFQHQCEY